jgi:hypothetical protein
VVASELLVLVGVDGEAGGDHRAVGESELGPQPIVSGGAEVGCKPVTGWPVQVSVKARVKALVSPTSASPVRRTVTPCVWAVRISPSTGSCAGTFGPLQIRELPVPRPTPGQVLIQVKAFGLNRSELHFRQGLASSGTFPRVPGIEATGVVAARPAVSSHLTRRWSP